MLGLHPTLHRGPRLLYFWLLGGTVVTMHYQLKSCCHWTQFFTMSRHCCSRWHWMPLTMVLSVHHLLSPKTFAAVTNPLVTHSRGTQAAIPLGSYLGARLPSFHNVLGNLPTHPLYQLHCPPLPSKHKKFLLAFSS